MIDAVALCPERVCGTADVVNCKLRIAELLVLKIEPKKLSHCLVCETGCKSCCCMCMIVDLGFVLGDSVLVQDLMFIRVCGQRMLVFPAYNSCLGHKFLTYMWSCV